MPQATVKSWDPVSRESVVITDDLVEHPVTADAFDNSTLLELRVGQRVRFEFVGDDDGREQVGNIGIVSL